MEDTLELIRRAHAGEQAARDDLVLENSALVWSIARRFVGRGYELEDLYQIGCIGLIKAIDRFDLNYEVRFSTYAVPVIMGEIKRFLRDDGMVKVSRGMKELGIKAVKARENLTWKLGHEPGIEEIAVFLGESREDVTAAFEAMAEVESIYRTVGNGENKELCILDKIPDENDQQEQLVNQMVLAQLLSQLSKRDREVITRRYFDNETQSSIAKDLHISQVQVSRLEKKILKELRAKL